MPQLVFSLQQKNLEEVSSNTGDGMDWPGRVRARRQRAKASFFPVLYIECHQRCGPDQR